MHDATPAVRVRDRAHGDLDACVALATEVHRLDGYPAFLGDGGLAAFVAPDDAIGAWVAALEEEVVGHVLLRPRSAPPSLELAARELGVEPDRLGFVARLMVAPRARRLGVARRLLDVAVGAAEARGLVAVLDVVTSDEGAVALYEATGWRRLGDLRFTMRGGGALALAVFARR
jgi:ribosomal protein S18 acetylase RimI-like enzyme